MNDFIQNRCTIIPNACRAVGLTYELNQGLSLGLLKDFRGRILLLGLDGDGHIGTRLHNPDFLTFEHPFNV